MFRTKSFQMIFICFFIRFIETTNLDEKYRPLREQCQRQPNSDECQQLKIKFLHLLEKCQNIKSQDEFIVCQQVKEKFCAIFISFCTKTTTTTTTTTKKKITTTTKKKPIAKKKPPVSSSKTTLSLSTAPMRKDSSTNPMENIRDEEFVEVPLDPEILRIRGEFCLRNGKEKKCQTLLNNLKTTYSSCSKQSSSIRTTDAPKLDCHSFQSHLCKAFPKFPPCLKKINRN